MRLVKVCKSGQLSNAAVILEDGTSRELTNEIILKGEDISNLTSLVKFGFVNPEQTTSIENIPIEFELLGNYPNPFNPSTTIKYAIPEISDVKIDIFSRAKGC